MKQISRYIPLNRNKLGQENIQGSEKKSCSLEIP